MRTLLVLMLSGAWAWAAVPGPAQTLPPSSASVATSAVTNGPPLERKVTLDARQMPLKDALAELCRQTKLELDFDEAGLKPADNGAPWTVSFSIKDGPLEDALWRLGITLRRQGFWDFRYELRGQKFFAGSAQAEWTQTATKTRAALPGWLKPLQGKGVNATVDDEGHVVSLYAGDKASDEFLANARTLPKLRELRIQGVKDVTREGLAALAEYPALEKLQLWSSMPRTDGGWGDEALRIISRIKTLRDLEISSCGLTDGGARAFETMTQLTALTLSGNPLTDTALTSLAGLTNLQKLGLGFAVSDIGFRQLSGLTRLVELQANGNVSGKLLAFPRLQVLCVNGEHFGEADFDAIVQCRDLRRVEITGMTDRGLARIAVLPELRQLDLSSDLVTDAGIAYLHALPKLERLTIRAERLTNESLRHLAEVKSLSELTIYAPQWFGIEDQRQFTIEGLLRLQQLPKLRRLWIYGFRSPTGFLALRELKQLWVLSLDFTPITKEEKELLEWAMPGTSVSAMSGAGAAINFSTRTPLHPPLPEASVFLNGRVVDATTGEAITNGVLQFGTPDPAKPGEIIWGPALSDPKMEVAGINQADLSEFWGESFRPGKVWARILAGGYEPELVTTNSFMSPLRLTNLVARLKRGPDLRGTVVDHSGNPAPGIQVYLVDQAYFSLGSGRPGSLSGVHSTTTDASGRFALKGGNGSEQRVVVASADGQMFAVAPKVGPGREVEISLPHPAAVIVRYAIPDDSPVTRINFNYQTQNLDPVVWKNLSFGFGLTVTNGGEVVLTNLTPGNYRFLRSRTMTMNLGSGRGRGRGGMRGAMLDQRTLTLEAGQTQRVDLVRPTGQTIRGEVSGIRAIGAPGAHVYAYSARTTNSIPALLRGRERPVDLVACGQDGQFLLPGLEPGDYLIAALAVIDPDDPMYSGQPDFAGIAHVKIATNAPPPNPFKIELLPWATATNQPAVRQGP